jgi:hypothetical protein
MKKSLILASLAGAAFASVALADGPKVMSPIGVAKDSIQAKDMGGFGARAERFIYRSTEGAGLRYFGGTGIPSTGDDANLTRAGLSAGAFPVTLTSINFTYGVLEGGDIDCVIEFFSNRDFTIAAPGEILTQPLGGFYFTLTQNDPAAFYFFGDPAAGEFGLDISGLGITVDDRGIFVKTSFYEAGTYDGTTGTPAVLTGRLLYTEEFDPTTAEDIQLVGRGGDAFLLDISADYALDAGEEYIWGDRQPARQWLTLGADTACVGSADFNNDGFVDFFDFDDYVAAFEGGC